jgi:hypothetical protein
METGDRFILKPLEWYRNNWEYIIDTKIFYYGLFSRTEKEINTKLEYVIFITHDIYIIDSDGFSYGINETILLDKLKVELLLEKLWKEF